MTIDLEADLAKGEMSEAWWKKALAEIEEHKRARYGKMPIWTPWGHIDNLKNDPEFSRRLYRHGKITKDFLLKLGIDP